MTIDDYRRKLMAEVAASREAEGDSFDAEATSMANQTASDLRTAIATLADEGQEPDARRGALQLLKAASFHSPEFPDLRADYLASLRRASEAADAGLRSAAFETLAFMKDRESQEKLLRGLRDSATALVPPQQALRFLGHDTHSGVVEVARELAQSPPNDQVRIEALRALVGDSESVAQFRGLLVDPGEDIEVRKLAATALRTLAPDVLKSAGAEVMAAGEPVSSEFAGAASGDIVGPHPVRLHLEALLDLPD